MGLDPLYLANEGKVLAVIKPERAEEALAVMRQHPGGELAAVIGEVTVGTGDVYLETLWGGSRILEMLSGSPLPRIC